MKFYFPSLYFSEEQDFKYQNKVLIQWYSVEDSTGKMNKIEQEKGFNALIKFTFKYIKFDMIK